MKPTQLNEEWDYRGFRIIHDLHSEGPQWQVFYKPGGGFRDLIDCCDTLSEACAVIDSVIHRERNEE